MIPKHKINKKIVEIDIKEFNDFVNYVKTLKKQLKECIEANKFLKWCRQVRGRCKDIIKLIQQKQ